MSWGGYGDYGFRPYVSVGERLANAAKKAAKHAKKHGREPSPVKLDGKKIATTFWGKAWCDNLVAYSDYASRLPRGATYVRNGSVVDLVIKPGLIEALVAGSETYTIKIEIEALKKPKWKTIKEDCSASIDSLLDLLAGRFSDGVMQRLTHQKDGLFPSPGEIKMDCSCPDWSDCCKHLAAVMYGIGARLDKQPELLFLLRDVDHQELVSQAVAEGNLEKELSAGPDASLAGEDLGAIFGIELDLTPSGEVVPDLSSLPSKAKTRQVKKAKKAAPAIKQSTQKLKAKGDQAATATLVKKVAKPAKARRNQLPAVTARTSPETSVIKSKPSKGKSEAKPALASRGTRTLKKAKAKTKTK